MIKTIHMTLGERNATAEPNREKQKKSGEFCEWRESWRRARNSEQKEDGEKWHHFAALFSFFVLPFAASHPTQQHNSTTCSTTISPLAWIHSFGHTPFLASYNWHSAPLRRRRSTTPKFFVLLQLSHLCAPLNSARGASKLLVFFSSNSFVAASFLSPILNCSTVVLVLVELRRQREKNEKRKRREREKILSRTHRSMKVSQ